jgi:uridylate kinase
MQAGVITPLLSTDQAAAVVAEEERYCVVGETVFLIASRVAPT